MMVTVLFAAYAIFDMTVRVLDLGGERLEASANARLGLERMAREIRAAYPNDDGGLVVAGDEDSITFANRPGSGPAEEITYDLSGGSRSYLRRDGQRVAGPLSGPEGLRFAYCESAVGLLLSARCWEPDLARARDDRGEGAGDPRTRRGR